MSRGEEPGRGRCAKTVYSRKAPAADGTDTGHDAGHAAPPTRSAPDRAVVDEEAEAAAAAVLALGAAVVLDEAPVRDVTMPLDVELAIELEPDCDEALDETDEDLEDEPEVIDAEAEEAEALPEAVAPPETARLADPPPMVPTVVHAEVAPAG